MSVAGGGEGWLHELLTLEHGRGAVTPLGAAAAIIQQILENEDELTKYELNFMRYFVDERLQRLEEVKETLEKRREALKAQPQDDAAANQLVEP